MKGEGDDKERRDAVALARALRMLLLLGSFRADAGGDSVQIERRREGKRKKGEEEKKSCDQGAHHFLRIRRWGRYFTDARELAGGEVRPPKAEFVARDAPREVDASLQTYCCSCDG